MNSAPVALAPALALASVLPSAELAAFAIASWQALLQAKPSLRVSLMVVNRFSGGAVAALQGAAGVNQASALCLHLNLRATHDLPHPPWLAQGSERASTTVDPAVLAFEGACAKLGLVVSKVPMRKETADAVWISQWPLARAYWWLAGFFDDITVYTIELD